MIGGEQIQEFTGVGAMGTVDGPVVIRPRFAKRRDKRRNRIKEEQSIIPDDAEKVDGMSSYTDTGLVGGEGSANDEASPPSNPELLHPTLALVAPDCTPDATKPLDPGRVPKPQTPLPVVSADQPSPSAASVLGLFTGASAAPSPVGESMAGIGTALMRQGSPMPAPTGKPSTAGATSALSRFNFNAAPATR